MHIHRLAIAAALAIAASASGQWLKYPTPAIPRTKDGKPNLSAPAPRAADGKPDFTGVWEVEHNRPCPANGCDDMWIPQEFLDIGWSLKGGLPYQPWAAEIVKRTQTDRSKDPNSHCLPTGIVRMYTTPLFRKIIQTPGLLVILNEREVTYRQIFTDGRPLPVDPQPSWVGYSTGKWEGDTLVIQTSGFREGLWLDASGSPLTESGKITERIRRVNFGKLEIEITVDDAKAYTSPWTVKLTQILAPDTDLLDYYCVENEKDGPHLVGK
ncbi:MAG: hypothetical protein JWO19_4269 [Bryobacterales bacterium]|nr:hypothetical protein [Bryobacterales bacterium]